MNQLRHFIDTQDFSKNEILNLLTLMQKLKTARYNGAILPLLQNRTLAMIFEEPSTRTRVSFEAAMTLLGGHAQYLKPGEIHLGQKESLYDTIKVLSHMTDGILIRAWKHETVTAIAKNADVPVFNGLSDYNHPTQALCDLFTILEHTDPTLYLNNDFSKLKIVFIGDSTNVCSSLMHITTKMGMNFIHIAPKKYQSPSAWTDIAKANIKEANSGSVLVTDDLTHVKNANIIYTDLWWWVDQEDEADERVKAFKPTYQITNALMAKAGPQAKFMHCLPASRNIEVMDEVIDGEQSIVFQQAENRLTAQLALLVYFIYPRLDLANEATKAYHAGDITSWLDDIKRPWKQRYTFNHQK
ncbi:ornithine carbamoyltransferase [Spiroplasma endosymbiont of Stenodema calcarata]|uniref:ornithine carbamoyltransferase n=1 Tax=Spiroplasma endosymbiont of Stenodema calcarata TaxID=3139328 RepID=UPI003CCAE9E6